MTDPVTLKINADELIKSALKEDITSEDVSTNAVLKTYVEGEADLICNRTALSADLTFLKEFSKFLTRI